MQYMFLIYDSEKSWADAPEAQKAARGREYGEFTEAIVKSGHFRAGAQLKPTTTATTVREKGGKQVTTDGPFAETKEQLGGYYLLECKDLDEALMIAGKVPSVRFGGSVEVRPLFPMMSEPAKSA